MTTTLTMPQLGESVVEGTIGKWLVQEGDRVERDQPVVEVLTDKADSEVPSPVSGVVVSLLAGEDDVVSVGAGLCEIDENAEASASPARKATPPPPKPEAAPAAAAPGGPAGHAAQAQASPAVRKLAREQGVDPSALTGGADGRVSAGEVLDARSSSNGHGGAAIQPAAKAAPPAPPATGLAGMLGRKPAFQVPPYAEKPGDEVVPFSRRRRIIADHMVYSKITSPHVVTVAECDLHKTARLRDAHKGQAKKEGISLNYLAFVCAATVKALREFRELNARVLDDAYVLLRDINLGVAVDTPQGLVVPVIRNADSLTVRGVARAIADMATKARDGNLTPDDLASKSFTVSNPGRRGNLHGGAIISQPNVGILRIGEIKKRVVVLETEDEDVMAIHPVMYMSLSYDHRIVDGVHANGFLYRITELLEEGDFEV